MPIAAVQNVESDTLGQQIARRAGRRQIPRKDVEGGNQAPEQIEATEHHLDNLA